jgi:hypothetical protein
VPEKCVDCELQQFWLFDPIFRVCLSSGLPLNIARRVRAAALREISEAVDKSPMTVQRLLRTQAAA